MDSLPRLRAITAALRHALRLAWASAPGLALAQTVLVTLQALLPLAAMYALKQAVDAATLMARQGIPAPAEGGMPALALQLLRDPTSRAVALWFFAGAAVIATVAVLRGVLAWVSEQHAMAVSDHVHGLLHAKLLEVDLAFEDSREQERLHLVQSQAMTRPSACWVPSTSCCAAPSLAVCPAGALPATAGAGAGTGTCPARSCACTAARFLWRRGLAPSSARSHFHRLLTTGGTAEIRLNGFGGSAANGSTPSGAACARSAVWRRRCWAGLLQLSRWRRRRPAALMTGYLAAGVLTPARSSCMSRPCSAADPDRRPGDIGHRTPPGCLFRRPSGGSAATGV